MLAVKGNPELKRNVRGTLNARRVISKPNFSIGIYLAPIEKKRNVAEKPKIFKKNKDFIYYISIFSQI